MVELRKTSASFATISEQKASLKTKHPKQKGRSGCWCTLTTAWHSCNHKRSVTKDLVIASSGGVLGGLTERMALNIATCVTLRLRGSVTRSRFRSRPPPVWVKKPRALWAVCASRHCLSQICLNSSSKADAGAACGGQHAARVGCGGAAARVLAKLLAQRRRGAGTRRRGSTSW